MRPIWIDNLIRQPCDWQTHLIHHNLLEFGHVPELLEAIATYDPSKAIILLVCGNDEADLSLLQDLAISPPDCYEQVRRRWDEFAS